MPPFGNLYDLDVYVAEQMPERLSAVADEFRLATTFTNMEDLLKSDADAIPVFSHRWMHAPQAIAALLLSACLISIIGLGLLAVQARSRLHTMRERADHTSRMVRLGRAEMIGFEHLSVDERIERVEAVTLEDIHTVAETVLAGPKVLGAVGPFGPADLEKHLR